MMIKNRTIVLCFILVIYALHSKALVLKLTIKDSVRYDFLMADTLLKGYSGTIETKGKKFRLGVFAFKNKGLSKQDLRGILAICKIGNGRKEDFYTKFDLVNCISVSNLEYLIIEGEMYFIPKISAQEIMLERIESGRDELLKAYNFLECIYHITYFDRKYTDSLGNDVPSTALFKEGRLNIIYYTITYCRPCEHMKFEMRDLISNKKINLNFITESGVKFDTVYVTPQKFFYNRSRVKNALGYPLLLLFDGKGNFIKSIHYLSSATIDKLKQDHNN